MHPAKLLLVQFIVIGVKHFVVSFLFCDHDGVVFYD